MKEEDKENKEDAVSLSRMHNKKEPLVEVRLTVLLRDILPLRKAFDPKNAPYFLKNMEILDSAEDPLRKPEILKRFMKTGDLRDLANDPQ